MSPHVIVNSIGLASDITGAILVWRFGLPEPISRSGAQHIILEQADQTQIDKARSYDRWAKVGVACLVAGFLLQLLSNFTPEPRSSQETRSARSRYDSVTAAAHTETKIFGPIWPHDSACYVWVQDEVAAKHIKSEEGDDAANAFAHCTDTAELEARKHPITPARQATIDARRAMGLPPLPGFSSDTVH